MKILTFIAVVLMSSVAMAGNCVKQQFAQVAPVYVAPIRVVAPHRQLVVAHDYVPVEQVQQIEKVVVKQRNQVAPVRNFLKALGSIGNNGKQVQKIKVQQVQKVQKVQQFRGGY